MPPLLGGGHDLGNLHLLDRDIGEPAAGKNAGEPFPSSSEKAFGTPGGGIVVPRCSPTTSKTTPSRGLLARGPRRRRRHAHRAAGTRRISRAARSGSGASIRPSRQRTMS